MTREEAIKILKESRITYIAPNGRVLATEALDMAIEELSKEKTAEWITKWDEEEREERHYCTNCNKYQLFQTEFCSHCGAKMKGEKDEQSGN